MLHWLCHALALKGRSVSGCGSCCSRCCCCAIQAQRRRPQSTDVTAAAPAAQLTCARRDTFSLLPLNNEAQVAAFFELKRLGKPYGLRPEVKDQVRLAEACDKLQLWPALVKVSADLVDAGVRQSLQPEMLIPHVESIVRHIESLPPSERSSPYNTVGNFKDEIGDYTGALNFYTLAYQHAAADQLKDQIYGIGNMGIAYIKLGDTISARHALRTSLALSLKLEDAQERDYNLAYDYHTLHQLFAPATQADSLNYYLRLSYWHSSQPSLTLRRQRELSILIRPSLVEQALRDGYLQLAQRQIDTLRQHDAELASICTAQLLRHGHHYGEAVRLLEATSFTSYKNQHEAQQLLLELVQLTGDQQRLAHYALQHIARLQVEHQHAKRALVEVSKTYTASFDRERHARRRTPPPRTRRAAHVAPQRHHPDSGTSLAGLVAGALPTLPQLTLALPATAAPRVCT